MKNVSKMDCINLIGANLGRGVTKNVNYFFFDFDAAAALTSIQAQAHEEIFERLTQDIFNASLGNW